MLETVKKILADQLRINEEDILPSSRIKEDLGADSLGILELLMTIEEEHGIVIPDEELATFETVEDIVAYLEKQEDNQ
ncbi:MAG: acyl carrier protein [Clostridia bacterium]|nr:acyl carrier protein [Clostridia bacterium]